MCCFRYATYHLAYFISQSNPHRDPAHPPPRQNVHGFDGSLDKTPEDRKRFFTPRRPGRREGGDDPKRRSLDVEPSGEKEACAGVGSAQCEHTELRMCRALYFVGHGPMLSRNRIRTASGLFGRNYLFILLINLCLALYIFNDCLTSVFFHFGTFFIDGVLRETGYNEL